MQLPIADLDELLRSLAPELRPGIYAFVSVEDPGVLRSIEVFATVREPEGLSAVLHEADARRLGLPILFRAGWLTLTVTSALHAVGLTAAVASALGAAGISCNVVAGARHDHLFVPVDRSAEALAVLQRLQHAAARATDAAP
jgi:hypothetical protein